MSESGAPGTLARRLHDRDRLRDGQQPSSRAGRVVGRGRPLAAATAIVCTITNTAKTAGDPSVSPVLECVVFKDGGPDVAYWGYDNDSASPRCTIRAGSDAQPLHARRLPTATTARRVRARAAHRRLPDAVPGGRDTLVWHLTGKHARPRTRSSTACTATVELRKVVVPADDPGVFELQINGDDRGDRQATARRAARRRIGIGEGTVERDGRRRGRASPTTTRASSAPGTARSPSRCRERRSTARSRGATSSSARSRTRGRARRHTAAHRRHRPATATAATTAATPTAAATTAAHRHRHRRPPPTPPPYRPARRRCSTSWSRRPRRRRRSASAAGSRGR